MRQAQKINDRLEGLFLDLQRHHDRLVELRNAAIPCEYTIDQLHDTISHTKADIAYNQELLARAQRSSK